MLQHSRAMYSISYISWLRLAAEYEGCSQLILTSPLREALLLEKIAGQSLWIDWYGRLGKVIQLVIFLQF